MIGFAASRLTFSPGTEVGEDLVIIASAAIVSRGGVWGRWQAGSGALSGWRHVLRLVAAGAWRLAGG